jgi:hydrogenase-4 membrane subunit HyfE
MQILLEFLRSMLFPLEIAMVLAVLLITIANSVEKIIGIYRYQSVLLAAVTGFSALIKYLEGERVTVLLMTLIIFLPFTLALAIEFLLTRATLFKPDALNWQLSEDDRNEARRIWHMTEAKHGSQPKDILAFVGMIFLAFVIAFQIIAGNIDTGERIGLMVSLVLHLAGLYNMIVKGDIISQVIGLLVMDQGLYLAVVKIVAIPVPATFFVISLYFYTLITIVILFFIIPRVRRLTNTIDLAQIADQSDLEG